MSRARKRWLLALPLLGIFGCQSRPAAVSSVDAALFGPVSMRIHPIFTQIRDWTGDGKPDGIEALVELQDQFGDPTKASGRVLFELFDYRQYEPDPRGQRLALWPGALGTLEDQQARWNRTSRTYSFQLKFDTIDPSHGYVLTATFELSGGGRFFDRTLLEGRSAEKSSPADRSGPASRASSSGLSDQDHGKEPSGVTAAPTPNSANPGNEPGARVPTP